MCSSSSCACRRNYNGGLRERNLFTDLLPGCRIPFLRASCTILIILWELVSRDLNGEDNSSSVKVGATIAYYYITKLYNILLTMRFQDSSILGLSRQRTHSRSRSSALNPCILQTLSCSIAYCSFRYQSHSLPFAMKLGLMLS